MATNNGKESKKLREMLSRRQVLGMMGTTALGTLAAGCGAGAIASQAGTTMGNGAGATAAAGGTTALTPSCVLTPEVTEGPYYLDLLKIRDDITEDMQGVPLQLRTTVVNTADDCAPLKNAAVDIWHCNAIGDYSGFTGAESAGNPGEGATPGGAASSQYAPPAGAPPAGAPPAGAPPAGAPAGPPPGEDGSMGATPTDDKTFLRGVQLTNSDGVADFDTIYPGWYQGRALHIHLKVHEGGKATGKTYEGGHVSHTGQLFFPEDVTDKVATIKPYSTHNIERVRNEEDGIFQQAGDGSIVKLTGSIEEGFVAEITLGVDPNAIPDPAGMGALPDTGGGTTQ